MKKKKSAEKKTDAKILDGIERACVALGLKPPKKLNRGFQLHVEENVTSEGNYGLVAYWSSPVPSKGEGVVLKRIR